MLPFDKFSSIPSDIGYSYAPMASLRKNAQSVHAPILYQSRYYSALPALAPLVIGHSEILPNSALYQHGFLHQNAPIRHDALSLIHDLVDYLSALTGQSVLLFEEVIDSGFKKDRIAQDHRLSLLPVSSDIYGMLRFLYGDWQVLDNSTPCPPGYQMMCFYPGGDLRDASSTYVRPYMVSKPSNIINKLNKYINGQYGTASDLRKKTAALF